jgi:hypothetical protein
MKDYPKNLQACLDWSKENNPYFHEKLQKAIDNKDSTATISIMLLGFEAGRWFQKNNPEFEGNIHDYNEGK